MSKNLRTEIFRAHGRYWVLASMLMAIPFLLENIPLLPLVFTEKTDSIKPMINYFYKSAIFPVSMICVTILYSTSFISDLKSGYLKFQIHRCGVKRFVRDRFLSNALAGATAVASSQILLLLLCCIVFPYPNISYRYFSTGNAWELFFYEKQYLYILILIALQFWGNLAWSSLALASSAFIGNLYITLFVPFLFVNILSMLSRTDLLESVRKTIYLTYDIDFWKNDVTLKVVGYLGLFFAIEIISYFAFYRGVKRNVV